MSGTPEKQRLLVVDDEHVIADTLATIFSNEGYDAKAAYSSEQAIALTLKWIPQLAIIDVLLPKMNGIELAILFKAEYPDCKIALFSGLAATSDLLDLAQRGEHAFDVLAKPIHPTEFLRLASRLLSSAEDNGGTFVKV
ncbi:MAG: response regulator [Silvibacterium sp.]